jgi:hypothetical protein
LQPRRFNFYHPRQPAIRDDGVHGMIAPKNFSQRGGGGYHRHGDFLTPGKTGPFFRAAVRGLHDQPGFAGNQPFTALLEPRDGVAAAPRQAKQFNQPVAEQGFDPAPQI